MNRITLVACVSDQELSTSTERLYSQVDIHEYEIECESRQVNIVLAGDREVMLEIFTGRPDGIVHGDDNRESPC